MNVDTLAGSGTITANGGTGGNAPAEGGGGGGGRVAAYYSTKTFGTISTPSGGFGPGQAEDGGAGTLKATKAFDLAGNFTSSAIDLGYTPAIPYQISWTRTLPANTTLQFQIASSSATSTLTTFLGPDGTANTKYTTNAGENIHSSQWENRYIAYKISVYRLFG